MADKQTKVTIDSSPTWRDHFKIDDNVLSAFWEEFSQASPLRASEMNPATAEKSIEFVLWCVQQGHFTEEAYIKWQSQAFEIPVIKTAFFESPTDMVFWERVKEIHPWSATCMPLAEWDDVLLIATTNPKPDIEPSLRHRIVLATPTSLREFFERVEQASVSNPRIQTQPEPQINQQPADKIDDGDPFAALSRELGLLNQKENGSSDSPVEDHALPIIDEHAAPAGLVVPEGLSFDPLELSRLNSLDLSQHNESMDSHGAAPADEKPAEKPAEKPVSEDSEVNFEHSQVDSFVASLDTREAKSPDEHAPEGGTLIHNFETGKDEIVDKLAAQTPIENVAAAPALLPTTPPVTEPAVAPAAELVAASDPVDQPALSQDVIPNADDDPLAALMMPASEPVKPNINVNFPGLPFAKIDESIPEIQNETVSQASPFTDRTFGQKPAISADNDSIPELEDLDKTHPSAVIPNPDPIAETPAAKKVVDAPPSTARIRKPLFEPVSNAPAKTSGNSFEPRSASGPGFDATKAVSIQNSSSNSNENTQTGVSSGTQTKGRRLDPTPVTNMFASNNNPAIHQERPNGSSQGYLNRSIAVGKLDPSHLDQCRSIDEAGAQAIMQACNIFETAMILLFKDGDLLPWKWNDLFLSVHGDKPLPIDLVEPSIFKIVFRTAKPYHGYVVTSEANQKFFNEFYRGMLPKHASVIPVMIDGRMGGMLLGFTNSKIDYRQSLRLMERLSFDLSRVFKSLRGTMSRAS
jgi:hypothetical protein